MSVLACFREGQDLSRRQTAAHALEAILGAPCDISEGLCRSEGTLRLSPEDIAPLADSFLSLQDLASIPRKLALFFARPRGILCKRLRSDPTAEATRPLFSTDQTVEDDPERPLWTYVHEDDIAIVLVQYPAGAPADTLGGRVAGFHEALGKVDKKALTRWVGKYLSRGIEEGAAR